MSGNKVDAKNLYRGFFKDNDEMTQHNAGDDGEISFARVSPKIM